MTDIAKNPTWQRNTAVNNRKSSGNKKNQQLKRETENYVSGKSLSWDPNGWVTYELKRAVYTSQFMDQNRAIKGLRRMIKLAESVPAVETYFHTYSILFVDESKFADDLAAVCSLGEKATKVLDADKLSSCATDLLNILRQTKTVSDDRFVYKDELLTIMSVVHLLPKQPLPSLYYQIDMKNLVAWMFTSEPWNSKPGTRCLMTDHVSTRSGELVLVKTPKGTGPVTRDYAKANDLKFRRPLKANDITVIGSPLSINCPCCTLRRAVRPEKHNGVVPSWPTVPAHYEELEANEYRGLPITVEKNTLGSLYLHTYIDYDDTIVYSVRVHCHACVSNAISHPDKYALMIREHMNHRLAPVTHKDLVRWTEENSADLEQRLVINNRAERVLTNRADRVDEKASANTITELMAESNDGVTAMLTEALKDDASLLSAFIDLGRWKESGTVFLNKGVTMDLVKTACLNLGYEVEE
jgi:hypothetical protein